MDNSSPPAPISPKSPISLNLAFLTITLVSLLLSIFFIYQNWRLTQKLDALIKTQPQPTLSPTPSLADSTTSWKTYTNPNIPFTLQYPFQFSILSQSSEEGNRPTTILTLEANKTFPNSHLTTRDLFQILTISNLSTPQTCYIKSAGSTPLSLHKTINGETFYYTAPFGGAAAGTHVTTEEYKVIHNNVCYEINLRHFESSDWNDPKDLTIAQSEGVTSFNILHQILSTFKFVEQSGDQNIVDILNKIKMTDSTIRWDAVTTTDTFRYPAQNGTDLPVQKISFTATRKEDFNKVNKIVNVLKGDGWELDINGSASGVGASYESYVKNIKGINYLLVFGFNNSNTWFAMTKI